MDGFVGCQQEAEPQAPAAEVPQSEAEGVSDSNTEVEKAIDLTAIFEQYFEENLELSPIQATFIGDRRYNDQLPDFLSESYRKKSHDFNVKWLNRIQVIDRESLSEQDKISHDLFVYQQQQSLEGEKHPDWQMPVNQIFSLHNFFAQLGSGVSAQPFQTVEDYENWLKRIQKMVVINDTAIASMRTGMQNGVVQPRIVMEKVLPQLSAHVVDSAQNSIFYGPINNLPEDFSEADKNWLTAAYVEAINTQVIPVYRSMHDFIRDEYLPACRETVGLSSLPNGVDWYNFMIKTQTTTSLTADEIHAYGLSEVARIRGEMEAVMREVGFEGDLASFLNELKANDDLYYTDKEALLQEYRDLQSKVNALLPTMFDVAPKAGYEVRVVEVFREQSQAGASY